MTITSTLRRIAATALVTAGIGVATAAPAYAESDDIASQCIAVGGVTRGCAYGTFVTWGSGQRWSSGGQVEDRNGGDSWYTQVQIKLDRQWFVSDTDWIRVVGAGNYQRIISGTSGYDPTDGAWVRLCTTNPYGAQYCLPSRYVSDNS